MSMEKYYGFLKSGNAFLETWLVYPILLGRNEGEKRDTVHLFFFWKKEATSLTSPLDFKTLKIVDELLYEKVLYLTDQRIHWELKIFFGNVVAQVYLRRGKSISY